jgi:hypothetical protein
MGLDGRRHATPRPLYPRERPGTHGTGGWVGPRAGLDGCGKCRPHRDSIPGPSLYRLSYPGQRYLACVVFKKDSLKGRGYMANVCDIEITVWDVMPCVLTNVGTCLWSGFKRAALL